MANENLKERKIYRILTNASSKAWDKIAFWTTAKSVDAADGKNLETKVGAIKGITTSTNTTTTGYAADATVIKNLNDSLVSNVYVGNDGKLHVTKGGADTVLNFSSTKRFKEAYKYSVHTTYLNYTYTVPSGVTQLIAFTNYPKSSIVTTVNIPTNFYLSISDPWGQSILFYEVKEGDKLSFNATGSQSYNVILAIYVA